MRHFNNPRHLVPKVIFNCIIVWWCTILFCLILVLFLFRLPDMDYMKGSGNSNPIFVPDVSNGEVQPLLYQDFPIIYVDHRSNVYFGDQKVDKLRKLPRMIKRKIKEKNYKGEKILVKIGHNVPYGKVARVFKCLSRAGIKTVGLMGYDFDRD